ncbi:MAG TPA: CHRD domain-containing protein [Thermomicrobiales bacterium]|jgi:hypothetical protein
MKVRRLGLLQLVTAVFAVAAFALAGTVEAARNPDADQGGRRLTATLLGSNEIAGGDLDGSGGVVVTLNQGQGVVCFELTTTGIATPTRAHIHQGPAGVNGAIVVDLLNNNTTEGPLSGCLANVDPDLIKDIRQNPDQYYFNVHNADFPGGALRGQLTK